MKILLVNNFFCPEGGAEQSTLITYHLLRANGYEVAFFATDRQPHFIPEYEFAPYFPAYTNYDEQPGIQAKVKALGKLFYNHSAESQMKKLLSDFCPDVVHCQNLYYHLTPSILKPCRDMGIPVVMTLRDTRLVCPAGTLMRGNSVYCKEELCLDGNATHCIQNRCYSGSLAHSALVTAEFYFRRFHKLYDTVQQFITPSQALADLCMRAGFSPGRVTVINNFVDDDFFNATQEQTTGQAFLFVGRLSKEKGVDLLIEAMKQLPPDTPLNIAGTGPDEAVLKQMVTEQNLSNIQFLGHLNRAQLVEVYRQAIATVVPSNWFENFSRTVIESAAAGKPVLGSKIGGIEEVVIPGETGYLFEAGDVNSIAQAMQQILDKPEQTEQMGRNARAKAESLYTSSAYLEKTLAVYRSVLSLSGNPETYTDGWDSASRKTKKLLNKYSNSNMGKTAP